VTTARRRFVYALRRALRAGSGVALSTLACGAVAITTLRELSDARTPAIQVALTFGVAAALASAIAARLRFVPAAARVQRVSLLARLGPTLADLQVGLALVAGCYAVLGVTGGTHSPAQALVYLLVAFSATFQTRGAVAGTILVCLALEAAAAARARFTTPSIVLAAEHAGFIVLSAVLHVLFLRGLVARQRALHRERVESEVRAMRDEAREFRLIASALGAESRPPRTREEEERKLAEGAVETIHASMFYTLELLKKSLDLRTCVLLWLDDAGAQLKIKELVTDSDCITETSLPSDAGALGAIVRDRLLLNLPQPKRGHVPYYAGPEEIGAFLGVPVMEGGHLRGVLCADRPGPRPFEPKDEALLLGATQQILRAIQSERVFAAVERSKYEHERFYHASAMLGRALTLEQVMDTAFEAAREIVDFDLASIALFDKERRKHRVSRVRIAKGAEDLADAAALDGLEFSDNAGLASMVVKNKHYLPAGGELRDVTIPVYTKRIKLKNIESLLVLPLVCADEAIGTFTIAARRRAAFAKDSREMLGVIANQVAVSIENAKMYKQMELMATTDGLTGLLNHRTFQERITDMISRAERHKMKCALILTDIDHFKKVNDTYGHPAGDEVLRRVARVLEQSVRKIDIVARYGGEEFAIVMEGADAEGAQALAERIRLDVAKQQIQTEKGTLSVTLSLGIAGCPGDGTEKQQLIERADQSLYHAKHNGRNRSVTYQQFLSERAYRRRAG
jgi:diguanylate cyclase (GGDEF)-like protein